MQQKSKVVPEGLDLPAHLHPVSQLGRGAYGTVYLCEDTRTNTKVAVKHVKQATRHGKSMVRETRLLARLRHENLLHLLDFPAVPGPDFEDVFLVLPYMPSDLHHVIQSKQALTEKHVQVIVVQILRALGFLHAAGVAHRDLKPANILIAADCKVKVCDFGLARGGLHDPQQDQQQAFGVLTEYVITRWYRAPEVMLLPKQYTSSVDVWSVGCILGEILGRKALFPGKNHIDLVVRAAEILGTPTDEELQWLPKDRDAYAFLRKVCPQTPGKKFDEMFPRASPECLDLFGSLLCWDPQQRPTCEEALNSPYLKAFQPKEAPLPPEPFDWSFDGFRPTQSAVKERLYLECARYHPEILERDGRSSSWGKEGNGGNAGAGALSGSQPKSSQNRPEDGPEVLPRQGSADQLRKAPPLTSGPPNRVPAAATAAAQTAGRSRRAPEQPGLISGKVAGEKEREKEREKEKENKAAQVQSLRG